MDIYLPHHLFKHQYVGKKNTFFPIGAIKRLTNHHMHVLGSMQDTYTDKQGI